MSIADGTFFSRPAFLGAAEHVRVNHSRLHLIGLIGSGGVHSSLEHILALLSFAKEQKIENVFLQLFTDGRDSSPTSSPTYLARIEAEMKKIGVGKIATLCGRYFGLDRDNDWERTQKAYDAITSGVGLHTKDPIAAIKESYSKGITDEFLEPLIVVDNFGEPVGLVEDHDAAIFFNFRIDRPRQLTKAFVEADFENMPIPKVAFDPYAEKYGVHLAEYSSSYQKTFKRAKVIKDLFFVTMTEYERGLPVAAGFPPEVVSMPLSRVIAEAELRQFHLAETEKERFVTYYFSGQREDPFHGEDRLEVPSPKVATYDKKPEMSAYGVTEELLKRLRAGMYDFILVNYANPDMVGHTGVLEAGIKACEVVDDCIGHVASAVLSLGGSCIITADHGNVEEMINLSTGEPDTEHSTNPVPFIIVDNRFAAQGAPLNLNKGVLADIAPTVLDLMGVKKPDLMTGRSLISK